MNVGEAVRIVEEALRGFPGFECGKALAARSPSGSLCVGWTGDSGLPRFSSPRLDLQVDPPVCWLLSIWIPGWMRGQGAGSDLYRRAMLIAASLGCAEMRATPSGTVPSGESRASWMVRRGWIPCGGREMSISVVAG
jgi:hypothetical protein